MTAPDALLAADYTLAVELLPPSPPPLPPPPPSPPPPPPPSPPPPTFDAPVLLSTPASLSGLSSAEFRFASTRCNSGLACKYICSLDNAPAFACTSPLLLDRLQEGPHVFTVRVDSFQDILGSVSSRYEWTVDTQGPVLSLAHFGAPTYLPSTRRVQMLATATEPLAEPLKAENVRAVNASVDSIEEQGPASYLVTLLIDPVWPEPRSVRAGLAGCAGKDASGNCGSVARAGIGGGEVEWLLDELPPTVSIDGPNKRALTDDMPIFVALVFSEPVQVTADSFNVEGGRMVKDSLQVVGGSKYALLVDPDITGHGCRNETSGVTPAIKGGGCVSVSISPGAYRDLAGNLGVTGASLGVTYDPEGFAWKPEPSSGVDTDLLAAVLWFVGVLIVVVALGLIFWLVRRRWLASSQVQAILASNSAQAGTVVMEWQMEPADDASQLGYAHPSPGYAHPSPQVAQMTSQQGMSLADSALQYRIDYPGSEKYRPQPRLLNPSLYDRFGNPRNRPGMLPPLQHAPEMPPVSQTRDYQPGDMRALLLRAPGDAPGRGDSAPPALEAGPTYSIDHFPPPPQGEEGSVMSRAATPQARLNGRSSHDAFPAPPPPPPEDEDADEKQGAGWEFESLNPLLPAPR